MHNDDLPPGVGELPDERIASVDLKTGRVIRDSGRTPSDQALVTLRVYRMPGL